MADSALFTGIAANWDATITNGLTQAISTELQANATLFTTMLTLYIIISGVLTAFGRLSMAEWVFGCTRAAILSLLLGAAMFSQYIQTPLMTTIPNWIAQSVNGSSGAQTGPQQFDALRNAVIVLEGGILQQCTGIAMIGERLRADFATWLICLELAISFMIWEMARALMGLIVAMAPFVLGLYLFQATRHVVMNLAGAAISTLLLLMLLAVLMSISITADQQWLAQSRTADASVDVQLAHMMSIALFFLFGMVMTVFLPVLAGRVGHGVLPGIGSLVASPLRLVPSARAAPGRLWRSTAP